VPGGGGGAEGGGGCAALFVATFVAFRFGGGIVWLVRFGCAGAKTPEVANVGPGAELSTPFAGHAPPATAGLCATVLLGGG